MSRSLIIRAIIYVVAFLFHTGNLHGQHSAGFVTGAAGNPSLSGAEGDGNLKMSYMSVYPGQGYRMNTFHLSYDTFVEPLHGGMGFAISTHLAGNLLNETSAMLSYSYHLRAARELFILAGMSTGLIYRGFNTSQFIFPDQIDPLNGAVLPGGETVNFPVSMFYDMGVGFTLIWRNSVISVDASHLFRPDLSHSGIPGAELNRLYTFRAFSSLEAVNMGVAIVPYGEFSAEKGRYRGAAGGFVEYGSLGLGLVWLNIGCGSVMQSSLYVDSERSGWLYGFSFRTAPGGSGLPFGVTHRLGIRMGLNIVDKRKTIKAIKLPEL